MNTNSKKLKLLLDEVEEFNWDTYTCIEYDSQKVFPAFKRLFLKEQEEGILYAYSNECHFYSVLGIIMKAATIHVWRKE